VNNEDPSVCVTLNCKVCKSAIALYYLFALTANGFLLGGSGTTRRHNTQNYTKDGGHTTHNEYNATTINRNKYTMH
jgi:hypothetical protein